MFYQLNNFLLSSFRRKSFLTILVLLFSIFARILYSSLVDYSETGPNELGDQDFYLSTALSIRETGRYADQGLITYYRPPGYSYFLSLLFSFDNNIWVKNILFVQSFLTYISSLCFFYALSFLFAFRVRLTWLSIWLITPFSFFSDHLILPESLYTSLIVLILSICFLLKKSSNTFSLSYYFSVMIGLLLGALALTREIFILFPFFLFPSLFYFSGFSISRSARLLLVSTFFMLLTITPWLVRNSKLLPESPPFISRGISGAGLFYGTWIAGKVDWSTDYKFNLPEKALHSFQLSTIDKLRIAKVVKSADDEALGSIAKSIILRHPFRVFRNWLSRSVDMWIGTRSDLVRLKFTTNSYYWFALKITLWSTNFLLVVGSVISASYFLFFTSTRWALLLASIPVYNFLIYLPFYNIETRYSHPSLPFLFFFLALIICRLPILSFKSERYLNDLGHL